MTTLAEVKPVLPRTSPLQEALSSLKGGTKRNRKSRKAQITIYSNKTKDKYYRTLHIKDKTRTYTVTEV